MIEWRTLRDWPDYAVSELGDVRRVRASRFGHGPVIRKPYLASTGYLYIVLRNGPIQRAIAVHRLVAMAFHGDPPTPEHQAAHQDGDRLNNYALNVCWKTRSENERDKIAHGRTNRGQRHWSCRLQADDVRSIRQMLKNGRTNVGVAAHFRVSTNAISAIRTGRSWAWLT